MRLGSDGGNSIYRSITYSNSMHVGERALGDLAAQGEIAPRKLFSKLQSAAHPPMPPSCPAFKSQKYRWPKEAQWPDAFPARLSEKVVFPSSDHRRGIVAKRKGDAYAFKTVWYKVKNPAYTQAEGRWELFQQTR
jgi:hypothetical protein